MKMKKGLAFLLAAFLAAQNCLSGFAAETGSSSGLVSVSLDAQSVSTGSDADPGDNSALGDGTVGSDTAGTSSDAEYADIITDVLLTKSDRMRIR